MKKLNPDIIAYLSKKTGKKESTIRKNISLLRRDFASCTLNAVAHIYAMKLGISILQKLDKEDKKTLPYIETKKNKITIEKKQPRKSKKIIKIIDYDTEDYFKEAHIQEVNKAYTKGLYTSANILIRKIIENLIIDILRKKFPPNTKENTELYYDVNQRRYKDFSIILDNLHKKRNEFELDNKKIVERLVSLAKKIKEDANDKTHSWFYLVRSKKEIDDLDIQTIIELIKKLEYSVGIRN